MAEVRVGVGARTLVEVRVVVVRIWAVHSSGAALRMSDTWVADQTWARRT
jgi:hypothetical protein